LDSSTKNGHFTSLHPPTFRACTLESQLALSTSQEKRVLFGLPDTWLGCGGFPEAQVIAFDQDTD
jgi:hypothetical protein